MAGNDRRKESGRDSRRHERDREEPRRDAGVWPYGGPSALGYRGPAYLGYPGYMSYPWSRYSHGMDPSYEDWQGPGFGTQTPGNWEPPTHSFERENTMVVRMELPGWDRDEVNVCVEDDDLVVEGRRQEGGESDDEHRMSREGRGGAFRAERFFTRVPLPGPIDANQIKAKFKNGILDIRVPLPEKRTERRDVRIET